MASHKAVVEAYIEGFRHINHGAILACLADDIVWVLHGYRTLRGKEAFDGEIENAAAVGSPTLNLDRLIEEGDTVVAVGSGEMTLRACHALCARKVTKRASMRMAKARKCRPARVSGKRS
jgi:ketosteroid isomerase-like protein